MTRPGHEVNPLDRRGFLQVGAAVTATAVAWRPGHLATAQEEGETSGKTLPRRTLGRTGAEVTILNHGTWRAPGLDRLLRFAYASGVRYFDTAKSYGSEPAFKRWFQAQPEVRKEIFLVTKDTPNTPRQLLQQLDERLDELGTDYIDLFFIHALGDRSIDTGLSWPKSKEFKETAEAIRKSGKARFVGFSTHHPRRAEILQAAAEGGFVDAIMLQYTPWLEPDSDLNKAIDACHAQGIGLISMKQVAGQFTPGDPENPLNEVFRRAPVLQERGLTPYQGLLHAIWTDERIASACVSMRTLEQVREDAEAARTFEPLTQAALRELRDAALAHGPTLCADCDGRCSRAAGTSAELGNLTRFLTYHEHHGYRGEARRLYGELSEAQRNWRGADLTAARDACPSRLDFARLLPKADDLLS